MIPNAPQPGTAHIEQNRNRQLDGLRAIAVTLVLLSHYAMVRLLANGLWGAMGVHVFFVLSGFLITGILLEARDKTAGTFYGLKDALRVFYGRRSLRIFPLYYLFLFFLFVTNVDDIRDSVFYHLGYASNVGMAIHDTHYGHNSHFWSLAVEEQFYLVWPWFVLLLPRKHIVKAIATMTAVAWVYRVAGFYAGWNDYALRMATPAVLDSLAAGCFLAVVHRDRTVWPRLHATLVKLGLWVAMPLALGFSVAKSANLLPLPTQLLLFTPLVALAAFGIIDKTATGWAGWTGKILQSRPLVYLGQRSYGIYVMHLCVPYFLEGFQERLNVWLPQTTVFSVLIPTAITLVAAELSWRLIERPFNNLKRHFVYKKARGRARWGQSEFGRLALTGD